MDSHKDGLLRYHPDTVTSVRKMFNLVNYEDRERAIDALEEWLKKQHHMTKKEYPRDYLERSIIMMKGSVERAKTQIDNLCAMRTLYPKYFDKHNARNDFKSVNSVIADCVLPTLTEDHYRVYILHFMKDGITNQMIMDTFKLGMLKSEYVQANDYYAGILVVIDFRNVSLMELINNVDIVAMHQNVKILMVGYGYRVKAIHAITSSKAAEILIKIVKPMLGTKISKRIHHHTTVHTLYDYISQDMLPTELGGYGESLVSLSEKWKDVLGAEENIKYLKEMSQAVSNEAYRMKEKLDDYDLGIAGTFRTLSVD